LHIPLIGIHKRIQSIL